jgi:DNA-binding winged helix-turn-helix (wHTH) protein/Tol biopolymer transport system component
MTGQKHSNYRFDEFELDLAKRRLLRDGNVVALKPKVFDLLALLVENNGSLLTKTDIFRLVWGDQFVEETNLTVSMSAIRRALGETANQPRYITNVSGRGYYFSGDLVLADTILSETHTISRIVVENEERDLHTRERLLSPPRRGWSTVVGFSALGILVFTAAVYGVLSLSSSGGTAPPNLLSVTRLTTSGRVSMATIAPDGKTFAFVRYERDADSTLLLSNIDGSEPIELHRSGSKAITGLAFSPDAGRIYFVEGDANSPTMGTVFRMPVLGGFVEKIREGVPAGISLSPDGAQFVFVRKDNLADRSLLIVASADGSGEHELASVKRDIGTFGIAVDWSPDGRYIAVPIYQRGRSPEVCELYAVSVNDGSMRQVTDHGWNTIRSVAWSRGSDNLLAAAGDGLDMVRQIWSIPFPKGEPRVLVSDSNAYNALSPSADDEALLAIQTQTTSNIWVAPASDLSAAKQVTFDMLGKQSGWYSLDWTNDSHIVFTGRTVRSDTVWEIDDDGMGTRQILPESKRTESVSLPDDGAFLVFTSNRSGSLEIWRAARDGTDLVQLTHGANNENSHVSPDGKLIVYKSGLGSDMRLMLIPSGGGDPVVLTDHVADWARFSPDSSRIACGYDIDGTLKLAILSKDSGPPQKIYDVPETANFRLGVRWTPDGKSVTYRDWLNGIWKQDLNGGEPVRLAGLPAEKLFAYAWSRDGELFAYGRGSAISDVVLMTNLR